ncbi:MAG: 50S ribosomal protein L1, partial [Atribacterota bacterium]|nr:50S ribosomal protein L1 [Atribacterota bacterium]
MSKKRGKKFKEISNNYDKTKLCTIEEAVKLVKELSWVKFNESVDVAIRLGINTKHSEEQVRGAVDLPHGTGKDIKVVVIAQGEKV